MSLPEEENLKKTNHVVKSEEEGSFSFFLAHHIFHILNIMIFAFDIGNTSFTWTESQCLFYYFVMLLKIQ